MTLFTRSIYSEPQAEDGIRISVMSRHTLNDGVTPDPEITTDSYHEHMKILAPPEKLVGSYYRMEIGFPTFCLGYSWHLRNSEVEHAIRGLAKRALTEDITLLCIEKSHEDCHREMLADKCKEYEPGLVVEHR